MWVFRRAHKKPAVFVSVDNRSYTTRLTIHEGPKPSGPVAYGNRTARSYPAREPGIVGAITRVVIEREISSSPVCDVRDLLR